MGAVADGDAVVTFNFRADRMAEISQARRGSALHVLWLGKTAGPGDEWWTPVEPGVCR